MQDIYSVDPAFQELVELDELDDIDLSEAKYQAFSPEEKITNLVRAYQNNRAEIEALKSEEKRLKERRAARERREEWYRKEVQACMYFAKKQKIKTPFYTAYIGKGQPSLTVTDEAEIPDEYFETVTTRKLDRRKLLDEMKAGVYIEGAKIEQKETINIRL